MYSDLFCRQAVFPVLFPVLALLCGASSCSVKEDREDCPCALYVKLENLPAAPVTVILTGEDYREEHLALGDTVLLVRPPKSGVTLQAVAGASMEPDGRMEIPYGFDSPPVYLYQDQVDTAADSTSVTVLLHKHFCNLSIRFDGPKGWGEPYWTEVRGPVDGILWDGTPTEGPFSCRLDDGLTVRLPRQLPDQVLLLDITLPDQVVRTFDLGYYLEQAGFDWTLPDLEDRTLEINLSVTALVLRIDTWSTVVPLEIVI